MAELQARLRDELARLGKDADRRASQAPEGTGGSVFDLHGAVIDPDGPPDGHGGGLQPPTGIKLNWTERLTGDYDMNGLVSLGDITPIAAKWGLRPSYDSPALHGGFASWPTGDPDDNGSGSAAGPGATNWRVARVDGDGNAMITLADITPIASHWQESLSGYRVYRKGPGESNFTMLANPDDASSPLTIPRSKCFPSGHDAPDQARPVRYGFTIPAPEGGFATGVYQFYVAAYDEASSTAGEPSATLSVELPAGTVNLSPVARLTVSPDFAGAPAVITLDASASYDADGSIAEYRWDLDDDGVVDYSTSDPAPPAQSSGGTVKDITPGPPPAPGQPPSTLTATYTQGSAQWFHPQLTVVDDKGAPATATATFGVSGWVNQVVYAEDPAHKPPGDELVLGWMDMKLDPATGEIVVAGSGGKDTPAGTGSGLYFARHTGPLSWQYEQVCNEDNPLLTDFNAYPQYGGLVAWQANGQPAVVFLGADNEMYYIHARIFVAERSVSGVWSVSQWYAGTNESTGTLRGASCATLDQLLPGYFVVLGINYPGGTDALGRAVDEYQLLTYDHGALNVEPVGWSTAEHEQRLYGPALSPTREVGLSITGSITSNPFEMYWMHRTPGGPWQTELLQSEQGLGGLSMGICFLKYRPDGDVIATMLNKVTADEHGNWTEWGSYLSQGTPGSLSLVKVSTTAYAQIDPWTIHWTEIGVSAFMGNSSYDVLPPTQYHYLLSGDGTLTKETIWQAPADGSASFDTAVMAPDGHGFALLRGGSDTLYGGGVRMLSTRVDPRLGS